MAEATNSIATASNPRVGPLERVTCAGCSADITEAYLMCDRLDGRWCRECFGNCPCPPEQSCNGKDEGCPTLSVSDAASAPTPPDRIGEEVGRELERLSNAASQGLWSLGRERRGDQFIDAAGARGHDPCGPGMPWEGFAAFVVEMDEEPFPTGPANAAFVVALVNAYRSGKLVASTQHPLARKGEV